MEKIKEVAIWLVFAFLIGAALTVGTKTVDYLWADNPREIIVKQEGGECE